PAAVLILLWLILSLHPAFQRLGRGENVPADELDRVRRRLVHLPWYGAAISGFAWLLGAIVFLVSLALTGRSMSAQLFWHLPISFAVSGVIATTQSFFLIELASHWGLLPLFFQDARSDRLKGIRLVSVRIRGVIWVVWERGCSMYDVIV